MNRFVGHTESVWIEVQCGNEGGLYYELFIPPTANDPVAYGVVWSEEGLRNAIAAYWEDIDKMDSDNAVYQAGHAAGNLWFWYEHNC